MGYLALFSIISAIISPTCLAADEADFSQVPPKFKELVDQFLVEDNSPDSLAQAAGGQRLSEIAKVIYPLNGSLDNKAYIQSLKYLDSLTSAHLAQNEQESLFEVTRHLQGIWELRYGPKLATYLNGSNNSYIMGGTAFGGTAAIFARKVMPKYLAAFRYAMPFAGTVAGKGLGDLVNGDGGFPAPPAYVMNLGFEVEGGVVGDRDGILPYALLIDSTISSGMIGIDVAHAIEQDPLPKDAWASTRLCAKGYRSALKATTTVATKIGKQLQRVEDLPGYKKVSKVAGKASRVVADVAATNLPTLVKFLKWTRKIPVMKVLDPVMILSTMAAGSVEWALTSLAYSAEKVASLRSQVEEARQHITADMKKNDLVRAFAEGHGLADKSHRLAAEMNKDQYLAHEQYSHAVQTELPDKFPDGGPGLQEAVQKLEREYLKKTQRPGDLQVVDLYNRYTKALELHGVNGANQQRAIEKEILEVRDSGLLQRSALLQHPDFVLLQNAAFLRSQEQGYLQEPADRILGDLGLHIPMIIESHEKLKN